MNILAANPSSDLYNFRLGTIVITMRLAAYSPYPLNFRAFKAAMSPDRKKSSLFRKVLTIQSINPNVKATEYAVRGALAIEAERLGQVAFSIRTIADLSNM